MNFDNLQDGQYVDITYRAGKTKKLIRNLILFFALIDNLYLWEEKIEK